MLDLTPFLTLGAAAEAETRVRGSRFLAVAAPAANEAEAREVLAERERAHFAATHHCSAWRLRGGVWRANDAGEPSGSAGAPILAAIDGDGLAECVVVVTRFYGGTNLGVGGLVRAYGEAAALAIAAAPLRRGVPSVRLGLSYGHDHTSVVMRLAERLGAVEMQHGWDERLARPRILLTLPAAMEDEFHALLRDGSAGALAAERVGECVVYGSAATRPVA